MRLLKTIITIILLFGIVGGAAGTTLERKELFGLYEKFIKEDTPFPAADLKITNFSYRPNEIVLDPGMVEYVPSFGRMSGRLGHRVIDINVMVDGERIQTIKMAADLHLYGDVVSVVRTLKRGSIVTRQDITVSRRDLSMFGSDLAVDKESLLGKQLKKTVRPGDVLFKSFVKEPQIIKRGDMIEIVASQPGLHISVPGQAKAAGALGDIIKVKNMMSRREIYGLISSEKEVSVTF